MCVKLRHTVQNKAEKLQTDQETMALPWPFTEKIL
jgi:hypothetical protein